MDWVCGFFAILFSRYPLLHYFCFFLAILIYFLCSAAHLSSPFLLVVSSWFEHLKGHTEHSVWDMFGNTSI